MTDSPAPRAAKLLGFAGLVPSLTMVAALVLLPGYRDAAAVMGVAYGALIASFVGGAWWGLVSARAEPTAQPRMLVRSVVPALLAWLALLVPPASGCLLLAAIFASLPPMDRDLCRQGVAPAWWFGLRRPLSLAMAGLHAAAAAILVFSAA
ncbi:DUF3429 domain-containing protein [Roseomonas eburnea]|uniref:DUF3429 domain-containing protein n=1 Tax=Neoroseomonas eburnea TaxID=1346889 RepID=A0A9X9X8B2_9PROT|nr:DUF3429 domain-containing protein [Neoroseomonas eburnea]MBR0679948.1 DUF3429 domain-containing protein [Neoroseomonas eburnea]